MIALLLLWQVAANSPPFEAQLVDGRHVAGTLVEWSHQQISFLTESGPQTWSVDQFLTLENREQQAATGSKRPGSTQLVSVELRGGTRLVAESVMSTPGVISLRSTGGQTITVPTSELKYIRFRKATDSLDKQFSDLLDQEFSADVLVIRRSETSLDYLEGVIHGISDKQVAFEFDNERIDVNRDKLEGCLFFSKQKQSFPATKLTITTWDGDRIRAREVTTKEQQWEINTRENVELTLSAQQIQRVRFSSNRVTYLSDVSPVAIQVTPAIGTVAGGYEYLNLIYAPRIDRGYNGPLRLHYFTDNRDQTFAKGIAVHSRTRQVFRLDGSAASLKGLVGMEPDPGSGGAVRLVIKVDDKTIVDQSVLRQADPVPLDVDVTAASRLEILVDYGGDGDLGDRVNLCDLRIIK